MLYRVKTGMLAWLLFRITGLGLVAYVALHINVISSLHDPAKFNQTMNFLGSWQFRFLEIGLFIAVLYHAMNGVRIFIIDFFNGSLYQAKLFWTLMIVAFFLFIAGATPIVTHALYWKNKQSHETSVSMQVTTADNAGIVRPAQGGNAHGR